MARNRALNKIAISFQLLAQAVQFINEIFNFARRTLSYLAQQYPEIVGRVFPLFLLMVACTLGTQPSRGATDVRSIVCSNSTRKGKAGMADEFAKRVKAGALPVMQKMDGFKGYYLIAGQRIRIIAVSPNHQ